MENNKENAVNKEDIKEVVQESKKTRKVLKIKNGEFLFDFTKGSVATCHHIKDAMDISDWDFEQLSFIISNLHKVGYKNTEVIEVGKNGIIQGK